MKQKALLGNRVRSQRKNTGHILTKVREIFAEINDSVPGLKQRLGAAAASLDNAHSHLLAAETILEDAAKFWRAKAS